MKNLEITVGHPFEYEWDIDYDIFDEDKIDPSIDFEILDKDGNVVLSLEFNAGLSLIKFDEDEGSKLVMSIFETDMIPEGYYTYQYHMLTFSGREIIKLHGELSVSSSKSDQVLTRVREVRPWDLLRNKASQMGERVSSEEKNKRLSICMECPRYVKVTSQCLECGCVMKLKTKLAQASCPLGKW